MELPGNRAGDKRSLLSPSHYDDDAASLRSVSDQESDSEDDQVVKGARNSQEIAEHDRSVLKEEEEREKLLTVGEPGANGLRRIFSGPDSNGSKVRIGRQERRRQRRQDRKATRRKKKGKDHEENGLMYEMEEGGPHDDISSASSSNESSELDREKFHSVFRDKVRLSYASPPLLSFSPVCTLALRDVIKPWRPTGMHGNVIDNGHLGASI